MMGWGVNDYPTPPEYQVPHCPVCGSECDTFFRDMEGNIVGCDECVDQLDAWDLMYQEEV